MANSTNEVNRMENPVIHETLDRATFFDVELQECPYHLHKMLREAAPVWQDPHTKFYVVSRYDDVRRILGDTEHFSSQRPKEAEQVNKERAAKVQKHLEEKGWLPAPTLALRDNPEHAQLRSMFDHVFRESRLKKLDPVVEQLAHKLIDAFIDDGHCEFARAFAIPLPLIIIGRQMGVPDADIWKIKDWTDSWVRRTGLMVDDDKSYWEAINCEIEAQHYFQAYFERLRKQPDGTLLSDLVNNEVPGWGRPMNDHELHGEMMADTFVGGSETSTNSFTAGLVLIDQNPHVWDQVKSNPDKYLRPFIEEVLRLDSPVQSRIRVVKKEYELHGVKIPVGATVDLRYGSANRDQRHFPEPEKLDLDRRNAGSHMAFGAGVHHCLGAPLARRELLWGFKAIFERFDEIKLAPGKNKLRHIPNFWLRGLKELHIEFRKSSAPSRA